jgi:hypothetical protein
MIGTILALIYIGIVAITSPTLEPACINAIDFLWYWHLVWGCICLSLPLGLMFFGFFGLLQKDKESKEVGGLLMFASPFLAILCALRTTALLIGLFIMEVAASAGSTFAEWNIPKLILGGIIYVLALIVFRGSVNTRKE